MTHEFEYLRDACARSLPGRVLSAGAAVVMRAWRSSVSRGLLGSGALAPGTSGLVQGLGIAVVVAGVMQPALILMMPAAVAPAFPSWGYLLVAMLAALIASQAKLVVKAWPTSTLRRLINLARRSVFTATVR